MRVRSMAGVLLRCEGRLLMMHRATTKAIAPGLWASAGGHLEPDEMNEPMKAMLRELFEETGIRPDEIENVRLGYIILVPRPGEMRVHYDFVADLKKFVQPPNSEEGTLHWLLPQEIPALPKTASMNVLLTHYLENPDSEELMVGVLPNADEPSVVWTALNAELVDAIVKA